MTFSLELCSILAIGFRQEDVESVLYVYIKETGHIP